MYYAEKIIDGVLHFKSSPQGDWKPLSAKRLTREIEYLRKELDKIRTLENV